MPFIGRYHHTALNMVTLCILLLCSSWIPIALAQSRNLTLYTQIDIEADLLGSGELNLPFTSILVVGPGANSTQDPPMSVRILQFQDDGNGTTWGNGSSWTEPQLTCIDHEPGFTLPTNLAMPNSLAWHAWSAGSVNASLAQSLMGTYGSGYLADAWNDHSSATEGRYQVGQADENTLFKALFQDLGQQDSEGAQALDGQISAARKYYTELHVQDSFPDDRTVTGKRIKMVGSKDYGGKIWDFDFEKPVTIRAGSEPIKGYANIKYSGQAKPAALASVRGANSVLSRLGSLQPTDDPGSFKGYKAIPAQDAFRGSSSTPNLSACKRDGLNKRQCASEGEGGAMETGIALARQQSVFATISMVSKQLASGLGWAGVAAGGVFVILHYIDGQFLGSSLQLAGMVIGIAVALSMEGPIGWLLGGAIATLFAILPGIFKQPPEPPPINNGTQIVQFKFFGDKDHTGNEKCQETNPQCVASYGPGVIALSLEWEYYDAVAFMIWANKGFTMSIPDIANALGTPASFNGDQNTSSPAVITCGNNRNSHVAPNRWGTNSWTATDNTLCNNPTMTLQRDNIVLPNINQTAGEIYDRIIPAPGGDCKIIDHADNFVTIPNYGITLQGLPVVIACGIDDGSNGDNTTNPTSPDEVPKAPGGSGSTTNTTSTNNTSTLPTVLNSTDASPSTLPAGSSPSNLATNGEGGQGYTPPPAPSPFLPSLNSSNAACFTVSDANIPTTCFPNGTYTAQLGTFGFKSHDATSLSFPAGSTVKVTYQNGNTGTIVTILTRTETYTTNQTSSSSGFSYNMKNLMSFVVLIAAPSPPPVACVCTETNYNGDCGCVGLGGQNMTDGRDKAKSVGIYGGATVTLYPNTYGDGGGQKFTVSVPDLTTVPYGTNGDLSENVVAVAVEATSHGVVTKRGRERGTRRAMQVRKEGVSRVITPKKVWK